MFYEINGCLWSDSELYEAEIVIYYEALSYSQYCLKVATINMRNDKIIPLSGFELFAYRVQDSNTTFTASDLLHSSNL